MSARAIATWFCGVALSCHATEPATVPTPSAPRRTIEASADEAHGVVVGDASPRVDVPDVEPEAEVASAVEPEVTPEDFFVGRSEITVDELIAEIDLLADEVATSPAVAGDYDDFVAAHDLIDSPELWHDYRRVKLAFEATRDGGWWDLHWTITNEQPNSEQIWKQWDRLGAPAKARPTADAECDELSALFAFVGHRLGVRGIGLFWPTGNHVVAVWTIPAVQSRSGSPVRIVVPTSQIFLTAEDSLGTTGFDPWTQKTIFEYRRRDVRGTHRLDGDLARRFVAEIARHGHKSQVQLQRERNERDARIAAAAHEDDDAT